MGERRCGADNLELAERGEGVCAALCIGKNMRVPQIPGYDASLGPLGATVPMLSLLVREEWHTANSDPCPPALSFGAQFAVSLFFAVFPNAAAGDLPFCNSPLILAHTVRPAGPP